MRVSVKVRPGAKQEKVEKDLFGNFTVWVKAKPVEGRANEAACSALAGYFGIAKSRILLIKGQASRMKVFEIRD